MSRSDSPPPANESLLIPINTASPEELQAIHGIGPRLSARLIDYRDRVGPFTGPDQLYLIKGLHQQQIERMAPLIAWDVDHPESVGRASSYIGYLLILIFLGFGAYLLAPMIDLLGAEFSHWQHDSLHWFTTLMNLLAICFTSCMLVLSCGWLISVLQGPEILPGRFLKHVATLTLTLLLILLVASSVAQHYFNAHTDIMDYLANLRELAVGMLVILHLQFLPQLLFLSEFRLASPNSVRCYELSLPALVGLLLAYSLLQPSDSLVTPIFLSWLGILAFSGSITLLRRQSYYVELLQELYTWPGATSHRRKLLLELAPRIQSLESCGLHYRLTLGIVLATVSAALIGLSLFNAWHIAGIQGAG